MNPIPNSPIKEGMRQQYESQAAAREVQINNKLNSDCNNIQNDARNRINQIHAKPLPSTTPCWVISIILGIIFASFAGFVGFLIGAGIGVGIYFFWINSIKQGNNNLEEQKRRIQHEANEEANRLRQRAANEIRAAYADADRRTQQDIDRYDAEVKQNCQAILKKPDAFKAMVDHSVMMFERMVSHADSASNRKFVETDFTYKVEVHGICYKYQSTYSNPKDDFNFDRERYRNLNSREECEGLAQAIAKMTISKMKSKYPPNSLTITVSHIDAEVTMHYKSANKNYVPPRDIF